MKTVILCGGRGTRLGEHGRSVPKALVRIGEDPILWHLIQLYRSHGITEFVLCLGFLGDEIREYFRSRSDEFVPAGPGLITISVEGVRILLAETGLETPTGGRLFRVRSLLQNERSFVTYGDGLADVDITQLLGFHEGHGKAATLTAVHPISNFGLLDIDRNGGVSQFREKPRLAEWVNGGFFVFEPAVFDRLNEDSVLELEPLQSLAAEGQLMAYRHDGFWKCMDTYKDSLEFNDLWAAGAPWIAESRAEAGS
jgi:glucose-1-phosphate cytidylyltransferase